MLERPGPTEALRLYPSHCASCQQAVTLHVLEVMLISGSQGMRWVCPHCDGPNTSDIDGRLVHVSRRQPTRDPERPPESMDIPRHFLQTYARCPQCKMPLGKILRSVSEQAWVFYYRCKNCGQVWTEPKRRH